MKTITRTLGWVVAAVLLTTGSDRAYADIGNVSGFVELKSAYLTGFGFVVTPNPVTQAGLTYTYDHSCLWMELLGSLGLNSSRGSEVDYTLGCTFDLNSDWSMTAKVAMFDLNPVHGFDDDIYYGDVTATNETWSIKANYIAASSTFDGYGLDVSRTLSHGFKLGLRAGREPFTDKGFLTAKTGWQKSLGRNGVYISVDGYYQMAGSFKDELNIVLSLGVRF